MNAPRVLVVDDEPDVCSLYADFLGDDFEVDTAVSGDGALDAVSEETDVVLLDRRMPDRSGDEVVAEIRERGLDCRIAMVTAVEPELDIVDIGFDDYVVKPVTRSELLNVIDSLLHWEQYDALLGNYFRTARKVAVLEETHSDEALAASVEYRRLQDRLESLADASDEALAAIDATAGDRLQPASETRSSTDP